MFTAEVERGVRIAVYDLNPGGRKTVFLVHGWPVDHRMFEYQLDVLPQLGFRCVCVDLRGFGNSDAPWGGYDYDRLADDLLAVVRRLNLPPFVLAGFSMGGPVVIRYMSRHNGFRVNRLALLAAAAPSFTQRPGYPYGFTADQVTALIDQTYQDRPQMAVEFGKMFFASKVTAPFLDWFHAMAFDASGHATIKTAETLRDADLREDLGRVQVPTGIFHGKLDQICPFPFAEEMHKGIRNSRIYPFEQSGHGVFYDELDLFNHTFYNFINA